MQLMQCNYDMIASLPVISACILNLNPHALSILSILSISLSKHQCLATYRFGTTWLLRLYLFINKTLLTLRTLPWFPTISHSCLQPAQAHHQATVLYQTNSSNLVTTGCRSTLYHNTLLLRFRSLQPDAAATRRARYSRT